MRVLYIEGVAIHGGPESCVGVRKDVSEALAGVRVGWAIEPRNTRIQGADAFKRCGRPRLRRRYRESSWDPARSENLGTHGDLHAREPGGPAVARGVDGCPVLDGSRGGGSASAGREGNAVAVSPR